MIDGESRGEASVLRELGKYLQKCLCAAKEGYNMKRRRRRGEAGL